MTRLGAALCVFVSILSATGAGRAGEEGPLHIAIATGALQDEIDPLQEAAPPPSDSTAAESTPPDESRDEASRDEVSSQGVSSRLALEGHYQGDHSYPDGAPLHGPRLGATLRLRRGIELALGVGWLGGRSFDSREGEVTSHRLTSSLALRFGAKIGPARLTIAPVGRLDTVMSTTKTSAATEDRTGVEIHAGLDTTWHLPVSDKLEAFFGAGALASVLSEARRIDGAVVLDASKIRIIWNAGVSWKVW